MKGKWAQGISPRYFSWIIKDQLAVSERPGGYSRNHRRVRRQEEIIWVREQGFARIVSLLASPHNLHAYDELDVAWAHIPFASNAEARTVLPELYGQLRGWLAAGDKVLVHMEELGDRLMGVMGGYLVWAGLIEDGPTATVVVERLLARQMGPEGRVLVSVAADLRG